MYKVLNNDLIKEYIQETPEIKTLLLDTNETTDSLEISEIGDGNLNFVYIVSSPKKTSYLSKPYHISGV